MSSTSSALNSLSTISVTDFYQKYFNKDASEEHYLVASRVFTVFWGIAIIPIAIEFASSTGSILEVLSKVAAYLVGAKLAMFGMGFFSKHVSERGLLIGVVAGFLGMILIVPLEPFQPFIDPLWAAVGLERPVIAWPWFVVIGSVINVVVGWIASLVLDGRKQEWHAQSVPGQLQAFRKEGRETKSEGWYVVPGKVEPIVWSLPVFFVATIVFLVWFGAQG